VYYDACRPKISHTHTHTHTHVRTHNSCLQAYVTLHTSNMATVTIVYICQLMYDNYVMAKSYVIGPWGIYGLQIAAWFCSST